MVTDLPCCALVILQVGSATRAHSRLFDWGVHAHKDDVCFANAFWYVGREGQVTAACLAEQIIEAGLEDRWLTALPSADALFININHVDFVVGTLLGNHCHGWPTNVSRTN